MKRATEFPQVGIYSFELYPSAQHIGQDNHIHITTASIEGGNLGSSAVGSINPVVSTDNHTGFRLFELWYGQDFDHNKYEVRFGRINPYVLLANARTALPFFNGAFDYPTYLGFGMNGTYFAAPLGIQVRATPRPTLQLLFDLAVGYDDIDYGLANRQGLKVFASSNQGFEGTIEAGFKPNTQPGDRGLPAFDRIGVQFHTGQFMDKYENANGQPLALNGGSPTIHRGDYAVYGIIDQMLMRRYRQQLSRRQGLYGFLKATYAPDNINEVSFNGAAGLSYIGPIEKRPDDILSAGISYAKIGRGEVDFYHDLQKVDPTVKIPDAETVIEANYAIQVTPWLMILLDGQRIIHPGGSSAIPDATVLGTSFRFAF